MSGFENESGALHPYPGLRPFRSDEDYLFFGREAQVAELLELLSKHRFVAVVGTSGSGKSSLVRCGLLSEIQGGGMVGAGSHWDIAVMQPGGDPMRRLAESLAEADLYDAEDSSVVPQILATLSRSKNGLVEAVRQSEIDGDSNLLLVVDQFEELFRFHKTGSRGREQAPDLVRLLLTAAEQSDVPIYVVLTMRSDFLGDCPQFTGLAEAVNQGEYLIPRLDREQSRAAIEGPARVAGGEISRRLVQRLLNDLGGETEQLPVLQHALMRTWDHWLEHHEEGEPVDLRHYEAIGTMKTALSAHADEVLGSLSEPADRKVAERVFRALTEKAPDGRGTRRPRRLGDLVEISGGAQGAVERIVEAYRRPGVTFLMPGPEVELLPETVIDISHESLMRVWERLRSWVEDEAQSARVYRRLVETARLWRDGKAGLYHDPDLSIAQGWREADEPNAAWANLYGGGFETAVAFLDASHDYAESREREKEEARARELEQARKLADARARSARNFKRFALGMGVVAAIAVAAFIFAFAERNEAERLRGEAVLAKEQAVDAKLTAEASAREAQAARETLQREFVRSDRSLAQSFVESGSAGRAIAHLARSLNREYAPDSPETIDRIFATLMYIAPPRHLSRARDWGAPLLYESVATRDGAVLATSHGGGEGRVRVWTPGTREPILPSLDESRGMVWHGSLAFSPDGSSLVVGLTGSHRGQLVDTTTWSLRHELPQTGMMYVRYSRDGKRLHSWSYTDLRAVIWNVETGESISDRQLVGSIGLPSWSPDEARIAFANGERPVVSILDLATSAVVELQTEGAEPSGILAWSPDGRKLLAHLRRGTSASTSALAVWSTSEDVVGERRPAFFLHHDATPVGESVPRYYGEDGSSTYAAGAFSHDGERILTVGTDRTIRLWSAVDGTLLDERDLPGVPRRPASPHVSEDGRRLMVEFRDGTCSYAEFDSTATKLADFSPGRPLQEGYGFLASDGTGRPLLFPLAAVSAAAIAPGDGAIVLGSHRGVAGVYDVSTGELRGTLLIHPGEITSVAISDDGALVATGSSFGTVRVWEAASSTMIAPELATDDAEKGLEGLAFAASGRELLVVDTTGVTLVDLTEGGVARRRVRSRLPGSVGKLSERGKYALFIEDWRVVVEEAGTGRRVLELEHDESVTAVEISSDGSLVATATGGAEPTVRVWAVGTGEALGGAMKSGDIVLDLDFRRDNDAVAAACQTGSVRLWALPTGASLDRSPVRGDGRCTSVVFGPEGRCLATAFEAGAGSSARVWEVETGRPLTPPLRTGAEISRVQFLHGGGSLVAWSEQGGRSLVALWDVSVSEGRPSPDWFPPLAEALGGTRLDDESLPVAVVDRASVREQVGQLTGDSRLERFSRWTVEFPGTRTDSPFRPRATAAYAASLARAPELELLDEALRLAPRDARALGLRACVRPGLEPSRGGSVGPQVLSRADLIHAELLATGEEASLVAWAKAIALDRMSDEAGADGAYARARELAPLSGDALEAILTVQRRFTTRASERLHLLGVAIDAAEAAEGDDDDPATRATLLRAERFGLALDEEEFEAARSDWQVLKEVSEVPSSLDPEALLEELLEGAEREAERLVLAGARDEALRLARPIALVAEIDRLGRGVPGESGSWEKSSILTRLVEWESTERPPIEVVALGSDWRFLDDGSDAGTEWRAADFDDSSWGRGPGRLGYGTPAPNTIVDYGANAGEKHITTYFRRRFQIVESGDREFAYVDLIRDDGAIVYVNGVEVVRSNMAPGPVSHTDPSSDTVGGADETRAFRYPIDPSVLRLGENVVAVEVHQTSGSSSDLGFDLRLVVSDLSPSAYLTTRLATEDRPELVDVAADWVPLPLRAEWKRDCSLVISTETTEEDHVLPDRSWVRRFDFFATTGRWARALEVAALRAEVLGGATTVREARQAKDWLKRKEIALGRTGGSPEAMEAVLAEILATPPRAPERGPKQLDLTSYYNVSIYDQRGWRSSGADLSRLPESFHPRHGVLFDIRGLIQLQSGELPDGDTFNEKLGTDVPERVEGIQVGQATPVVHFLMSCRWGRAARGDAVARFVMRYDDGTSATLDVRALDDVDDWYDVRNRIPLTRVGWRGRIGVRNERQGVLSELVWANPHPEKTIQTIDFVSTLGAAAPFLVAITLE